MCLESIKQNSNSFIYIKNDYISNLDFLINCFIVSSNIDLPEVILQNKLFWFKLIETEPTYIKYVRKYIKQDFLDLLN